MKSKLIYLWENIKASTVAKAGLVLILASAIQNYPWLISWLGDDVAKEIQTWIATMKVFALGVIALFVKQWNMTGGSKPMTEEAVTRAENIEGQPKSDSK